eukprot:9765906-Lingulodinium_polyedra.AAC.1
MFDRSLDSDHDILGCVGFVMLAVSVLSLRQRSTAWFGIPCSSWVWISRSATGRSTSNLSGWQTPYVKSQNAIAQRAAALIELARSRGVETIIEQPISSLLFAYPPIKNIVGNDKSLVVWMKDFGGDTAKPL